MVISDALPNCRRAALGLPIERQRGDVSRLDCAQRIRGPTCQLVSPRDRRASEQKSAGSTVQGLSTRGLVQQSRGRVGIAAQRGQTAPSERHIQPPRSLRGSEEGFQPSAVPFRPDGEKQRRRRSEFAARARGRLHAAGSSLRYPPYTMEDVERDTATALEVAQRARKETPSAELC